MRVTVLGSGSAGNATLVEAGGQRLLIDAGFSGRDMERRLAAADIVPESISALLITHDHGDHTRGMGVVARRWGVPLYLTAATHTACERLLDGTEAVRLYPSSEAFTIGLLTVQPFLTVHDAVDPVAVTITETATAEKLGIATDLGRPTAAVRHALRECDLLILEANHDEVLLHQAPYPSSVRARIGSSHGHLSNRAAADLARDVAHPLLSVVVLAHLSEKANDPALAHDTVGRALHRARFRGPVHVARQDEPLDPIHLTQLRRKRLPPQLALF